MTDDRPSIKPNPPRFKPTANPEDIVIPGLDTGASYLDQIEQMDHMITMKLQTIDANFAKAHSILANKILPAVKRFAASTEPVRESAKFWVEFYEKVGQMRMPAFEEYHSVNEQSVEASSSQVQEPEASTARTPLSSHYAHETIDDSLATTGEGSFMPTNAQFASTPATAARHGHQNQTFATQNSDDPSWSASIESPFVRLGRDVQTLDLQDEDDEDVLPRPTPTPLAAFQQTAHSQPPSTIKGKEKETVAPVFEYAKPKLLSDAEPPTRIGMHRQKYQHDPLSAQLYSRTPQRSAQKPPRPIIPFKKPSDDDSDSDSDYDLPAGMSPPVTMSPVVMKKNKAARLMQSPVKQAAARISKDLLGQAQKQQTSALRDPHAHIGAGAYASRRFNDTTTESSSIPSPPDISKHFASESSVDAFGGGNGGLGVEDDSMMSGSIVGGESLESLLRRGEQLIKQKSFASAVSASAGGAVSTTTSANVTTIAPLRLGGRSGNFNTPADLAPPSSSHSSAEQQLLRLMQQSQQDSQASSSFPSHTVDSDSDSDEEEINNTAHPSAAFLLASQRRVRANESYDDDSFGSSNRSSDSMDGDGGRDVQELIATAAANLGIGVDDDSFDYDRGGEEETIFGLHPSGSVRSSGGGANVEEDEAVRLSLHGEDLDTAQFERRVHPMAKHLSAESPTAYRG